MTTAELNQQLAALIEQGASLTLPDGMTIALADAVMPEYSRLWYCEIWPGDDFAQHWLDFSLAFVTPTGPMIELSTPAGLAVIAKLDDYERDEWQWEKWTQSNHLHTFVAELKTAALQEKQS